MIRLIRKHQAWLEQCLRDPGTDWKTVRQVHLTWIGFLQHERTIHLVVTLAMGVFLLVSAGVALWQPGLAIGSLVLLLAVLEGFYVVHLYRLENALLRWYSLDREMWTAGQNPSTVS